MEEAQLRSLPRPPLNLWEFSKATIAQVHGYCVGGGTVYGFLCDITVASDDACFQMPLPQGFGLPGAQTIMEPWVLMNFKRAYEYLYLGKTLSAEDAKEWGFINEVKRADLESTVEEMAATIAQMPLTTIMTIKQSVKRAWRAWGCGSTCRTPRISARLRQVPPMSTSSWPSGPAACPARSRWTEPRRSSPERSETTNRRPDLGCSEAGRPVARPMAVYGETVVAFPADKRKEAHHDN